MPEVEDIMGLASGKEVDRMKRILTLFLTAVLSACILLSMGGRSIASDMDKIIKVSCTDALGRTLHDVKGFREDRYVGLFYFLWLGQQNQKEVYDITSILRTHSINELVDINSGKFPNDDVYFFNEPLFGYYNSEDPWVIRKHIELFIYAQIDFLVFDITNGIYYDKVWFRVLEILDKYRLEGYKVPQIVFFTNTRSDEAVKHVYQYLYKRDLYKELWFYGPYDKPLIIANADKIKDIPDDIRNFFHIREAQWPLEPTKENGFPYMDLAKPQHLYTNLVNVSVCQFSGPCSFGITKGYGHEEGYYGRGYSKETPESGVVKHILEGRNFEEQWSYALEVDPEMVFVTGWNEWIAQKSNIYGWIDTFNTEWSRDIEMTKAKGYSFDTNDYTSQGYGDNYYMQLVRNIRKYKGTPLDENYPKPQTMKMDVYGEASAWDAITNTSNIYLNAAIENSPRDYKGASPSLHYTQDKADNFLKEIKVTNDDSNLYFYIRTEGPIVDHDKEENIYLLLSVRGSKEKSWEGYHYIVNRKTESDKLTILEKVAKDDSFEFEEVGKVKYSVKDNIMQMEIPLALIGVSKDKIEIEFKVADSIEKPDDIMDYYVSGSSAPIGRLNFTYLNMDETQKTLKTLNVLEIALGGIAVLVAAFSLGFLFNRSRKK